MKYASPDLTQHPPRSPRVQLGGYVILPRLLDKCRAVITGKNGEYHYACPLDQRFLQFTGVSPDALKAEVAKGSSDSEILAWIQANAPLKHTESEITQWSGTPQLPHTLLACDAAERYNRTIAVDLDHLEENQWHSG